MPMNLMECTELNELITRFNAEEDSVKRYALAEAIKAELQRYITTLDESILPLYRNAAIRKITGKKS